MDVDAVVDEIREREEERAGQAERLREELAAADRAYLRPVEDAVPGEMAVGGVDGGLAQESLHGMDVVLTRAVAAVFDYADGELSAADYHPSKNPSPDVAHTVSTGRQAADRFATLQRLDAEAAAALSAVGDADMLLMDGSLVPQPGDRPDEESDLFDRYEAVMADYRELYARAEAEDTALVGVVEDARSARFCRFLDEAGMDADAVSGGRDTVLLHHVLEPGERTCTVPYAAEPTPVLRDLEAGDSVYVFYLRTSRKDRPVRIEFYAAGEPGGRADAVASRVLSLCGSENAYGLPPVLLEADQRAALSRNEVEVVTKRIRTRLAHLPGTEELRRDRRPF